MFRLDPWFTIAYLLASLMSLLIIFSISPERLVNQGLWLALGFVLYLFLASQDSGVFTAFTRVGYPLAILLLILTFVLGESVRGSVRWIPIGGFNLQTSELAKPLLILAFARFMALRPPRTLKTLLSSLLTLAIPLALILRQPDLGTGLVLLVIFASQLFVAGLPGWLLGLGAGITILVASFAPAYLHDYQLARLESFIDPASDPLGSGYNVIQSQIAIGSGGLFGKGLGHGTQSHLRFLPERHTDFIFASLVEELGMLGGLFVIIVLGLVLYRLTYLMLRLPLEERLVLAGIFGYLLFQTSVNIGMNLGIAPVTGVTLPLISYGGSSILAIAISFGIAGSIAKARRGVQDLIEIK